MSRFKKLAHTIWHCKYHIVWVPKYRFRILKNEVAEEITDYIRAFSESQHAEIVELNVCVDHVHVLVSIPPKLLRSLFTRQPCWMIAPLASQLDYSIPSVRRFLAQVGYLSSFSWCTLSSIPRFDIQGLWFHEDIGFSRAGSLTNTLVALASASADGMSAEQIGEKLRCRSHSVLVQLCLQGRLQRHKAGRCYLYLADVVAKKPDNV